MTFLEANIDVVDLYHTGFPIHFSTRGGENGVPPYGEGGTMGEGENSSCSEKGMFCLCSGLFTLDH